MSIQQYIERSAHLFEVLLDIGKNRGISLVPTSDADGNRAFYFRYHPQNVGPVTRRFLHLLSERSQSSQSEVYCLAQALASGLKLFQPPELLLDSFEHYDLNVRVADYHQPFTTFFIDLPAPYAQRHRCSAVDGEVETPLGFLCHYERDLRCMHCVIPLGNSTCLTYNVDWADGDKTIEETIVDNRGKVVGGQAQSQSEWDLTERLLRSCLNLSLMATNYGLHELGPANPSHFKRTTERVAKAVKKGDHDLAASNQRQLLKIPICFGFEQTCPLLAPLRGHGDSQSGNARSNAAGYVRPHWRRGHWRTQRFGPGLSQTKTIAIPAVLVNADLVLGGPSATTVMFTDGDDN